MVPNTYSKNLITTFVAYSAHNCNVVKVSSTELSHLKINGFPDFLLEFYLRHMLYSSSKAYRHGQTRPCSRDPRHKKRETGEKRNKKKKQYLGRNYSRVFLCQSVFQNSTDDCARSQTSYESACTAGMDIPKCD